MRKFRNLIFYIAVIGGFLLLMYGIALVGAGLEAGRIIADVTSGNSAWSEFVASLAYNLHHPLAVLLAQIIAIILVARVLGWLCAKIGQPSVIGEIIAGIVLGPSLLGYYFPEFSAALFPAESLGNLQFLSQIGLILFMYVVGMELDLNVLRNKAHDAVVISHASIVIPFALGMGLSYFMYMEFAPANVRFVSFGLFMGIAMSITAFPVLARIVQERGIMKTRLGTVAITCAAADDITAWCVLAGVIAIVKAGSFTSALYVIALSTIYVGVMLRVVRPFLSRLGDLYSSRDNLSKPVVAVFFLTLLLSAFATEVIGIHALFGAFMAGAIMPENPKFRHIFVEKIEDVALVLLLPLFFVYTGLRTEIGLLSDMRLWAITGLVVLVAVVGKFVGSALAARFVGQSWPDSLTIGALMNTRGLMELVVLNIGYDLGVMSPEVFAMMVIMALVTTFMTGPSLSLIQRWSSQKGEQHVQSVKLQSAFKVLVSFGNPEMGRKLLRLASALVRKNADQGLVTALHLSPNSELTHYNMEMYEEESFAPILDESNKLGQPLNTMFKGSTDIERDIVAVANKDDYDLLLVGLGQSIFEGSLLGRLLGLTSKIINPDREHTSFDERTRYVLANTAPNVGILVDKGLKSVGRVYWPVLDANDQFMIPYLQKLIMNSGSQVTISDAMGLIQRNTGLKEAIRLVEQSVPSHVRMFHDGSLADEVILAQDLMIVSLESWKKMVEAESKWLKIGPSTLILRG